MERTEESALSQPQESGRPGATRRPASPLVDPSLASLLTKSPTLRAGLAQADSPLHVAREYSSSRERWTILPNAVEP